ncbi:YidC/Oxa1 family insertase periplasmic-domain containing protein, partial [Arthrospira platensis SPKY1]|nr:YidC/Oxa1 family insertase periplasmic-domain containing protein [Arthrospira platensis SPKY1]
TNEPKTDNPKEATTEQVVDSLPAAKVVKAIKDSTTVLTDSIISLQAQQALGVLAYSSKYAKEADKEVVIENDLLHLRISPKGGYIQEAKVKPFERFFKGSGEDVVLIKEGNADFNIELKTIDNRTLQSRDLFFEPKLQRFDDKQVLTLRLKASENQYLEYV